MICDVASNLKRRRVAMCSTKCRPGSWMGCEGKRPMKHCLSDGNKKADPHGLCCMFCGLAAAGAGGPFHAAQLARGQRVVSVDVGVGRSSSLGNEGQTL